MRLFTQPARKPRSPKCIYSAPLQIDNVQICENGDEIVFDGPARTLELCVSAEEIARRLAAWKKSRPASPHVRGYARLYVEHVMQATDGCDFDFLAGGSGSVVERESH